MKQQFPFWLITIALIIGLVLPSLIQDGMFMDGMFYTVVSKNLANGQGSFWFPFYSLSGFNGLKTFHEHPPLVFGIESIFFRVLGNGSSTERIYTLLTLIASVFLINATWKESVDEKKTGWLPLLLWIITPLVFWSFSNNMQENTMGIFVLMAVYFYMCSLKTDIPIFFLLLTGISIFLASFSKGVPGLFPLALPFIAWVAFKRASFIRVIGETFLLLLIPSAIYFGLLFYPEARESLSNYVFKRLLFRVTSQPTVDSHFWILYRLLIDIALPIALTGLVYFYFRIKRGYRVSTEKKELAVFFILTGLAGTAPMMLTLVQRGFYFVPALPFFALGLAMLITEPISKWSVDAMRSTLKTYLNVIGVFLLCCALFITWSMKGQTKTNVEMLHDIYLMGPRMKQNIVYGRPPDMWDDWSFEAYTMRFYNMGMMGGEDHPYYVMPKNSSSKVPDGFKKIDLPTQKYDLYERQL